MREVEDTPRRCEECQTPIISGRFCGLDSCRQKVDPFEGLGKAPKE